MLPNLFLRLKHWQLFLAVIGLPLIAEIIVFSIFIATKNFQFILMFIPLILLAVIISLFGWYWVVGVNLIKKLHKQFSISLIKFKFLLLYPVIYLFSVPFIIFNMIGSQAFSKSTVAYIIPFHLLGVFCILNSIFIIAKALKTVEENKKVSFSDFAGEFFLIWFFPIGIWFIQPRINKIFALS